MQAAPRPLRQQVFEFVRAQGQAARADITHAIGISAASTTTLTADLIAAGYLREFERLARVEGRGRPKVSLEVVPDAGYVIGIKLAFEHHTAVLSDFAGSVVAQTRRPSSTARRPVAQLMDETQAVMASLLRKAGRHMQDVNAVGIGLPGIIDHSTGTVIWSSLLDDRDADIRTRFTERFNRPLSLDNDANMLTLAELWFGEGRRMSDFAVVTVESGVGMGLVLNNQLYRGAHGMGLELGHTKVQFDGALCQCGQRGCLEAYLADYALTREAATILGHRFDPRASTKEILAQLFADAQAGHAAAEAIFRRARRFLSIGLSNVVQLFDPALIILSGERMQYDHFFTPDVLDEMRSLTLNEGRRTPKVTINAWDDMVWARGATALALSAVTGHLIGGAEAPAA
ncbi:MAG: ROK family protein [Pseudomonadota bacterium]